MQNHINAFDAALDAWNESDPSKIRGHLNAAVTSDVYFVDPTIELTGKKKLEKLIHEVQARFPGAVFSRTSNIDTHHHIHRYHWEIIFNDALLVQGFDVVEVRDGKIARLLKFFGELPTSSSQ